jgi:hypothetical protein
MKLESIIQSAVEKGDISIVAKNQMLKSTFWSGLRDPLLKNSSRYKFDIKTTKGFEPFPLKTLLLPVKLMNLCNYPHGMKLESIIQSAVEKGDISIVAKNQMLKSKFWSGLRDPLLKNSSRYKFPFKDPLIACKTDEPV